MQSFNFFLKHCKSENAFHISTYFTTTSYTGGGESGLDSDSLPKRKVTSLLTLFGPTAAHALTGTCDTRRLLVDERSKKDLDQKEERRREGARKD